MIEYCDGSMPTSKSELPDSDSYICIFPSIGLKEVGKYEHWLAKLYSEYPHADYYKQHSSTGKRAQPGTFAKYAPTKTTPGIINLYTKVYPGHKDYPSDNSRTRIDNFGKAFGSLAEQQGLGKLHIMIPTKVEDQQHEYVRYMNDFISTAALHGGNPTIYVYGCQGPLVVPSQTMELKAKVKAKAKTGPVKLKLKPKILAQQPKQTQIQAQAAKAEYKLEFNPEQVSDLVLYEIDFFKATVAKNVDDAGSGSVLKYFNNPNGKWTRLLDDTKLQKEAQNVHEKLQGIIGADNVFPQPDEIFNAFTLLESEPKVVIIGQDPYPQRGKAHGLSFSVKPGVTVPPSLRNIYSALENDPNVEFTRPKHGCLESWAKQGVIMLNAALTVEEGKSNAHKDIWCNFTDRLIQLLSIKYPGLVYVLWGGDAKKKRPLLQGSDHMVLEFNHPSPMVRNNTFGTACKHFSEINAYLTKHGKTPINWQN